MSLRCIRLVTFDATNTLLKFKVQPWEYYTILGRDYGFEGSNEEIKSRLLDNYKLMWKKYPNFGKDSMKWEDWWRQVVKKTFDGQLPSNANVEGLATQLINDYKTTKCWHLTDGSHEVLNYLRNYGAFLGVISNFDPRLVEILHNVKIDYKLDFIYNSFDIGFAKPDRKIFDHVLMKDIPGKPKNLLPKNCLHIGDDVEKDYKAAKAAGWNALLISKNKNLQDCIPKDHIFPNLIDLRLAISNNKLNVF